MATDQEKIDAEKREAARKRWEAERAAKAAEVASHVDEMFADDENFSAIDTPENRKDFLKHVLDATFYGEVRVEYHANEEQVQEWLDETIKITDANRDNPEWLKSLLTERNGDLSGQEPMKFKEWLTLERLWEEDLFGQDIYETAHAIADSIEAGGNKELARFIGEMDTSDLVAALEDYGVIFKEVDIIEPNVKANVLFATPDEMNHEFLNIPYLADALEKEYEARNFIDDPELANAMMHNALNYLATSQDTNLAEIMDPDQDIPDGLKKFADSVREEMDNRGGGYGHLLTALARTSPEELYKMFISPSLHINRDAVLGLYEPSAGTGSVLGIELGKDGANIPTGLIYDIEIEDGGRRQTLDNVYGMASSAWREGAITGCERLAEAKPGGVEEFAALVQKRMEIREAAADDDIAPGY